jgi:hypothetical protein
MAGNLFFCPGFIFWQFYAADVDTRWIKPKRFLSPLTQIGGMAPVVSPTNTFIEYASTADFGDEYASVTALLMFTGSSEFCIFNSITLLSNGRKLAGCMKRH